MKKTLLKKINKAIPVITIASMVIATLSPFSAIAGNENEKYPYTMFAASEDDGAITVNADNFCVNGNIASNGTIASSGSINVNGTKTENAGENMIYIFDKIDTEYFDNGNTCEYEADYTLEDTNININVPTEVMGETTLNGNINITTALKSLSDINLLGEVKNTDDSIIFSKYGNIIIDSTNVNVNGLIYAPFGTVEIKAQNLNLNNVVIIANKIVIECSSVNANYSSNAAEFVGVESETFEIPNDEKIYLDNSDISTEDNTENDNPDDSTESETTEADTDIETAEGTKYNEIISDFDNWNEYEDTDQDGLPDELEEIIGSNITAADTDNDKLNDYYEFVMLGTSPILSDTDGNGILDCDEDFDNDGLSNIEEYEYDTIPWEKDTDNDSLSDGDEISIYLSDPLNEYTDNDSLKDGEEPSLGFDPTLTDTDNNGIPDGEEKIFQTFIYNVENEECVIEQIELEIECSGNLNTSTSIESIMGIDVGCSNIVGLVGEPFEIETSVDFETATIIFKLDTKQLIDTEFDDLTFIWYDEDNGKCVEIETFHDEDAGIVSMETNHFSKYMLVDGSEWEEAWSIEMNYGIYDTISASSIDTDTTCYTGIIIDGSIPAAIRDYETEETGTEMTEDGKPLFYENYKELYRPIAESMINNVSNNNIYSIGYLSLKDLCSSGNYTSNKTTLIFNLDYIYYDWIKETWAYDDYLENGYADRRAMDECIAQILTASKNDENAEKNLFIITAANFKMSDSLILFANQKGIKINTIAIGEYANKENLINIANITGGLFYYLPFDADLQDFQNLYDRFDINLPAETDTDSDGLPDVIEIEGVRTQFGNIICTDPADPDSDDDGLLDGEEIDPTIRCNILDSWKLSNIEKTGYCFFADSNPLVEDTDGDGYSDYDEVKIYKTSPRYNNIKIYQLENDYISVENGNTYDEEDRYYGGAQYWLKVGEEETTQSKYGCGLISSCDILLYLASYNSDYYTDVMDTIEINSDGKINYYSYIKYLIHMEDCYFPIIGDPKNGIWGTTVANKMQQYSDDYDLDWDVTWCFSKSKILSRTEEMIKNDIPVMISANEIKSDCKKDDENWRDSCPKMYTNLNLDNGEISHNFEDCIVDEDTGDKLIFYNHYATITGIVYDSVQNETWLHVSSWGQSYYIKYSEYEEYLNEYASLGGMATNILCIEP